MRIYQRVLSVVLVLLTFCFAGSVVTAQTTDDAYIQPEKFIYGDVDMDGVVTVKDATLVQKGVAGITYVAVVQRYLADPAGEGFNVKNATAIQKYLAGHEVKSAIGEEVPMSMQNEFSGGYSVDWPYYGRCIYVTPKDMDCEYRLEDFPEYQFSRIIRKEWYYLNGVYYELYLENPGKENALEALKALDYRADIDLESVYLDGYAEAT